MQLELLRTLFLRALAIPHGLNTKQTFSDYKDRVLDIVRKELPAELDSNQRLKVEDEKRVLWVAWDLILQRVIVPGHGDPQSTPDGWPWITVTDYGKEVIRSNNRPTPYEPDGFIVSLPLIGDTVRTYLTESISSFRTGNQLAAAVMLGAASEKLFMELCDAFGPALSDPNQQTQFQKASEKLNIKDRIKGVVDWLKKKKDQLPEKWRKPEQIELIDRVAELVRLWRNDAGHPKDPPPVRNHEEIYAELQMFRYYCGEICELKKWLLGNVGKIT